MITWITKSFEEQFTWRATNANSDAKWLSWVRKNCEKKTQEKLTQQQRQQQQQLDDNCSLDYKQRCTSVCQCLAPAEMSLMSILFFVQT